MRGQLPVVSPSRSPVDADPYGYICPDDPHMLRTPGGEVAGDAREEPGEGSSRGFFAPDRDKGAGLLRGGRVSLPRLCVRVAVCVAALVALDFAIAPSFAPPAAYLAAYRLPRTAPTASIADFAAAIDLTARSPARPPIAVFLGASPTYGHRIKDASNTFPCAFETAAAASGRPFTAFNLATNGQLVGDYLVLAKRFASDADVVFVQLTYHTFSPALGRLRIRYPELPAALGVPVSAADSALLGQPVRPGGSWTPGASSPIDAVLGRWWTLWRERDVVDRRLFGGPPRQALAALVASRAQTASSSDPTTTLLPDDAADDGFASFDDLEPGARMVIVARYAKDSSFTVSPSDDQVRLLDALARDLAVQHKKAVFFLSPMNRDVIDSYELIDPTQYAANVRTLRSVVEPLGFPFIDLNTDVERIPASDFADISHTNDAGGALVGRLLWSATGPYLATVPR